MIGTTLGKYRLVAQLGRGGMAEVYKAYQPSLDRYVAIKVLHPKFSDDDGFVERFEQEAALVARLRHPNIVQVYDFDVEGDRYFMVMELIEGPTLTAELEARTRFAAVYRAAFTPEETVGLFSALASAVDYAHARGAAHRDLKPTNIMFTADGQVVLTDFGIARIVGAGLPLPGGRPAGTPAYMAPEMTQGHPGDRLSDLYALGVILYELMTGRVPFIDETPELIMWRQAQSAPPPPTTLNPDVPAAVEDVILRALCKNPAERYPSAGAMANALREAFNISLEQMLANLPVATLATAALPYTGPAPESTPILGPTLPPAAPPCPYRGLFAFREKDAVFFFGREEFTDRLAEAVEARPLVAVVGPSGSGKSSVVFAGLLPRFKQAAALRQAQGKAWISAHLRPGSRPFEALAVALTPGDPAAQRAEIQALADHLRRGAVTLADAAQRLIASQHDAHRLLLVVDQFEELFTLCPEPEVRRAFMDALLEGLQRQPTLRIVLTLRADFLGQAFSHRPLADVLQDSTLILGPMTRAELGRAVKEPARKQGVRFQSGLVERILDDVGDEPGNLPLLEFALTALWDRQSNHLLTHDAYEEIERVDGALARYAEEVYDGLPAHLKESARRIFVQMVRPGENTEDTRRQATRAQMEDAWPLVQQLASARLLVTNREPAGQETAEIVHEALIGTWRRLREWMRADRAFRAWQERLRSILSQWEASGRDEGALLRGALLVGAEGWLAEREAEIGQAERDFIRASMALREREAAEREALRQRELETARQIAEAQTSAAQRGRRRQVFAVLASLVALAALASAVLFGWEADQARAQARQAQAREWAALAQAELGRDPQLGLLLALAAVTGAGETVPAEARQALEAAVRAGGAAAPADLDDLIALARAQLTRTWTDAECRRYLRAECPADP